jgi:hypothetical protein
MWIILYAIVIIAFVILCLYVVHLSTKGNCQKCGMRFEWNDGVVFGTNNNAVLYHATWQRNGNTATKYESYKKFWENTCKSCGHVNAHECHYDRTPFEAASGSSISVLDCPMCSGKGETSIKIGIKDGVIKCGFCEGQKWVPKDKVHGLFHNKML